MNPCGESLALEVSHLLGEHGYKKICRPLEDIAKDIEYTSLNIDRKVFLYKWSGITTVQISEGWSIWTG